MINNNNFSFNLGLPPELKQRLSATSKDDLKEDNTNYYFVDNCPEECDDEKDEANWSYYEVDEDNNMEEDTNTNATAPVIKNVVYETYNSLSNNNNPNSTQEEMLEEWDKNKEYLYIYII